MEDQTISNQDRVELHDCERRHLRSSTPHGAYSLRETESYDTSQLYRRLNALLKECDRVAQTEKICLGSDVEQLCGYFADLLSFPAPSVYLDGDKKWCFDWDDREDGKGVYCRLENPKKLLVIVDEGDQHLRLPCMLNKPDPIRHLRYGIAQIYGE